MNNFAENELFSGNYICSSCGKKMRFEGEFEDILVCPHCGFSIELNEYLGEDDTDEYFSYTEDIPEGCAACGGPYPECIISCKLFDD